MGALNLWVWVILAVLIIIALDRLYAHTKNDTLRLTAYVTGFVLMLATAAFTLGLAIPKSFQDEGTQARLTMDKYDGYVAALQSDTVSADTIDSIVGFNRQIYYTNQSHQWWLFKYLTWDPYLIELDPITIP